MTWQVQDKLIYNSEIHFLEEEILEYIIGDNMDLKPNTNSISSDCWRGYVATFEIVNFELLLKNISMDSSDYEKEKFLSTLFSDPNKMKLSKLNCILILYKNKLKGNYNSVSLNIYETYELLEIKNGNLNDYKLYNHEDYINFRNEQFEYFMITDEFIKLKKKRIEDIENLNIEERILKNKKDSWFKYQYDEINFKKNVKDFIFFYSKKFL
jgi:hypothetical protein